MGYLSPHASINRHRQPLPRMLSSPSRFWDWHPFHLTETGRAPRTISRANMNTSITSLTRSGSPCRSSYQAGLRAIQSSHSAGLKPSSARVGAGSWRLLQSLALSCSYRVHAVAHSSPVGMRASLGETRTRWPLSWTSCRPTDLYCPSQSPVLGVGVAGRAPGHLFSSVNLWASYGCKQSTPKGIRSQGWRVE